VSACLQSISILSGSDAYNLLKLFVYAEIADLINSINKCFSGTRRT